MGYVLSMATTKLKEDALFDSNMDRVSEKSQSELLKYAHLLYPRIPAEKENVVYDPNHVSVGKLKPPNSSRIRPDDETFIDALLSMDITNTREGRELLEPIKNLK